jgi:hypothetical protein
MRYIHNIQHCLFTEKLISIVEDPLEETEDEDYLTNNKVITIGYVTSYQNEIRIQRYIINKNIPNFVIKDSVKSDFNECPEMIKLIKGLKIIVVSKNGNKLHIYDYVNNSLLYCLYLGNDTYNINDINLGIKNKFLMIYYKVYQIDIIKMDKDLKKVKCTCSDDNNKFIYKRLKTFDFNNKSKINNVYSSGTIINKGKYLEYLCQFDPKKKDIINVVNNGGFLTVYQFDRKQEGDKFKTLKNVCLFEEDLTEF